MYMKMDVMHRTKLAEYKEQCIIMLPMVTCVDFCRLQLLLGSLLAFNIYIGFCHFIKHFY